MFAMLVVLPLGLYLGGLAALVTYAVAHEPFWFRAAYTAMLAGGGVAILSGIAGALDFVSLRRECPARELCCFHAAAAIGTTGLFTAAGFVLRTDYYATPAGIAPPLMLGLVLAILGTSLAAVTTVLGWQLERAKLSKLGNIDNIAA